MDTISHGVWTYIFASPFPRRRWYAVIGALFPDSMIILMFFIMLVQGDLNLFDPWFPQIFSWQPFFVIDSIWHSVIIWSGVMALALYTGKVNLQWFVFGVYFHIGVDIITHKYFIINYFWPLNLPVVEGILEYRSLEFTIGNISLLALVIGYGIWMRKQQKQLKTYSSYKFSPFRDNKHRKH